MTLARYLSKAGFTAADCARGTGRTRAIVSAWLLGLRFPTFDSMLRVQRWSLMNVTATERDWPRVAKPRRAAA
mgnify:CR=1